MIHILDCFVFIKEILSNKEKLIGMKLALYTNKLTDLTVSFT